MPLWKPPGVASPNHPLQCHQLTIQVSRMRGDSLRCATSRGTSRQALSVESLTTPSGSSRLTRPSPRGSGESSRSTWRPCGRSTFHQRPEHGHRRFPSLMNYCAPFSARSQHDETISGQEPALAAKSSVGIATMLAASRIRRQGSRRDERRREIANAAGWGAHRRECHTGGGGGGVPVVSPVALNPATVSEVQAGMLATDASA